ncbi:MAG: NADPH:quinone oxidoreductase family protein [Nitrospirae bacterium]|nr:NADPH:quinone oxidoreductase family protein [Nitrospirota bacterium]
MRAWQVSEWCEPEDMKLVDLPEPKPDYGWTRVRVEASALNFYDILMIQGKYQMKPPLPFTPGNEISGVVEEAGPGSRFKPGDRIMSLLLTGGYAEQALAPDLTTYKLPDEMSFEHAAAFQAVYQTSYFGLVHRAQLMKGEWLLVSAAAGGVGLAAVQIGRALGAKVIAAVGSEEKFSVCLENGAHHAISYRDGDWVQKVKDITGDHGADVICDAVGGDFLDLSLKCIAWEGRAVIVGFTSGRIPQVAANRILLKNIAVMGIHWGEYRRHDNALVDRTQDELYRMYAAGQIRPVIYKTYPLSDARQALAELADRRTHGKIILQP